MAVRYVSPILVVLFFVGILKVAASWLFVNRLRIREVSIDEHQRNQVLRIVKMRSSELSINTPEVIFSGRGGFAAFAAGIVKPAIILNASLLPQLSELELDNILTHELVHISRGDTLRCWLLNFLRDAMFFSPFSRILLTRYLLENERLCDKEAVKLTRNPKAYAATLVKVGRLLLEGREVKLGLAVSFTERKSDLEQRVVSILGGLTNGREISAPLFMAMLLAVFAGAIIYLGIIC